ncbi:polyamine aminopropyltransferase [Bacteroidota bacterium]
MEALGKHIIVEYFECDTDALQDVVYIENSMTKAAEMAGATIISSSFHHFSPFGVSGVIVIQESHLSIHTWPEYGFASVDIFTCGESVDPWIAYNYLKESLKAVHGSAVEMNRGHDRLLPKTEVELEKFRDGRSKEPTKIKSRRDIWFTERDEDIALSIRHEGEKLYDVQSDYQRVEVYKTIAYGNMLTLDGKVMCTEEDEYVYHEMIAHVPMLTHPNPRKVLVIGGGDGGTIREVVRHPEVEQVTLVEIDEKVIEASKLYFPNLSSAFNNPKLNLVIEDGVNFVKVSKDNSYDIVIVDSNDPVGPGEGLFTREFYNEVHRILAKQGIMITQSESPRFNRDVFKEIYSCYKEIYGTNNVYSYLMFLPSYPTGMWSFSYSSKGKCHPLRTIDAIRQKYLVENHQMSYYNSEIHRAAFATPEFVKALNK